MHEATAIKQFQHRLVELGCPSDRLDETVREFADHFEDLKQDGLDDGLTESDAEAHAEDCLGDAKFLAEQTVAAFRRSSWWGRHPVVGFCLLPFFALGPVWVLCGGILAGICWILGRVFGPAYNFDLASAHALASDPDAFQTFAAPLNGALMFSATFLVTLIFLWLARRAALGLKWKLIACAVCSVNTVVTYATVAPGAIFVGFGCPSPDWIYTAIPLLAAYSVFLRQRTIEKYLPQDPENRSLKNSHESPLIHSF